MATVTKPTSISVLAPAKINLRLKITGRRADGYHLLSMLNAMVGIYDQIEFFIEPGSGIIDFEADSEAPESLGNNNDNLVYKAARLFFEKYDIHDCNLKISLTKNIPIGAGLGGGSSDGAITLLTLSRFFAPELTDDNRISSLVELAISLGSDLPFFIHAGVRKGGLFHVSGIGEIITQLDSNPLSGKKLLVISPQVHLSTQNIFKAFATSNNIRNEPDNLHLDASVSYLDILQAVENDLSLVVQKNSTQCQEVLTFLKTIPNIVYAVTGSGSSIFCLAKNESDFQILNDLQLRLKEFLTQNLIKSQIVDFL